MVVSFLCGPHEFAIKLFIYHGERYGATVKRQCNWLFVVMKISEHQIDV